MALSPTSERLLTVEEFLALPEPEDGSRMELVDGELVVTPPPSPRHASVASRIVRILGNFVADRALGDVLGFGAFMLSASDRRIVGPDVAFVASDQLSEGAYEGSTFQGAPALAVEVISPSETTRDIERKLSRYLAAGCARVWHVYPVSRQVIVYRSDGHPAIYTAADALTSDDAGFEVEGFELPLNELFA